MKRLLSILLVFSMLLAFSACGVKPAVSSDSASSAAPVSVSETEASETSEDTTPTSTPTPASEVSAQEPEDSTVLDSVAQDVVLVDDENCTMTLVSVSPNNAWGYTWNVFMENKTDKNLMFSLDNVSINGVMCDPFWATIVSAGKKSNEEISWMTEDFEQLGITDVTVVEFDLSIYDDDDWNAPDLVNDTFTVYPLGQDAVQLMEYTPGPNDKVLFDNDECTMIVTGFDPDGLLGYTMNTYLVNKTDRTLFFSADNVSVNDAMCDPFWGVTVSPGKAAYQGISWSPDDFNLNSISTVEQIQMDLIVFDNDTLEDVLTDTFVIEP